jgi:4,5-dihydroxyphthalate decarboxylase
MMTKENLVLKTLIGSYGNTKALKDGTVKVPGVTFDFVEVVPVYTAFKDMARDLAFDVSEMAMTTYMVAKSFDKKMIALPIILVRIFHHGTILCNVKSGIREPKDLEGKKVGIRAYAQTGPTWSRGILQNEYGVDLRKVTWVTYEDSHVAEFKDPAICVRAPKDKKMPDMLVAGEIDAMITPNKFESPNVKPLFPNASAVEAEWFRKAGIYPVNHIVVMKSELAKAQPGVAKELFAAFQASKQRYLDQLYAKGPSSDDDKLHLRLKEIVGGDPLPYGVSANRKGFETLAKYCFEQKMLPKLYTMKDLFEPSLLDS